MSGRAAHPLDPLTAAEVEQAAAACRAKAAALGLAPLRFNTITLEEPAKEALLGWGAGRLPSLPRRAACVLQTPPEFCFIEATVDLAAAPGGGAVLAWTKLDGAHMNGQPLATPDDCLLAEAIAREDAEVQRLVAARGVEFSQVACDPWAIHACPPDWCGRLMQVFMYRKDSPDDNEYAHPMDLCPVVDLNRRAVVHIDAYPLPPPIPSRPANFHHRLLDRPFRQAPSPLLISQPQGPSFAVDGWRVSWQAWDLRLSFNGREGLVLHDVAYTDAGRRRPIAWRMSIAEMVVPYADPRSPYHRKCALDAGDYGLGFAANSLQLGCDCLGEVRYFDGVVNDSSGAAVTITNAICLHEEDHGLLWKHLDYRTGYSESRRGRRLVMQFIMTAVNYDYIFAWMLYQDGSIECNVKLTGILSTSLLSPGEERPSHGTLVNPGVNAAAHQHLFCARLDLAVDDALGGRNLAVSELDARQQATSEANPAGNAFVERETALTHVHAAQRLAAPHLNRVWRVANPARTHPHSGAAVAYHLYPAAGPVMLAQPDSAVAKRAAFATKSLWVTPYEEGQLYPAGKYVFQSASDSGLAEWTRADRSLLAADPVLWYCFGITHFVRPEDYPVMPRDEVSFLLKPFGFFDCNPALDLPPEAPQAAAGGKQGSDCCSPPGAPPGPANVTSNLPLQSRL